MLKRTFIAALAAVLAAPVLAANSSNEGLVARNSRNLDKVLTAASWPSAYRSVHIPPIEVEFQKIRDANAIQRPSSRPSTADIARESQELAQTLRASMQRSLRKAGYHVVASPGAGVLVLKTSLEDVRVNAPSDTYGGAGAKSLVKEAGEARLHIEGFDGALNARVLVIDDRARPRSTMPGLERANTVTNRFWFQNAFDHWADSVVRELPAAAKAG